MTRCMEGLSQMMVIRTMFHLPFIQQAVFESLLNFHSWPLSNPLTSPSEARSLHLYPDVAGLREGNGNPLRTLAWKIPWTEEPGGLQSTGSLGVRHDFTFTFHFHALEKAMATHSSVLAWRIPGMGEPSGLLSLGLHRLGHDWSELAAAVHVKVVWCLKHTHAPKHIPMSLC